MMTKKFSTREKVLLIIMGSLLLFAIYYLAVYNPTASTIADSVHTMDELADLLILEEAKAVQLYNMRKRLNELDEEVLKAVTPDFDNFQNLLNELNSALASADNYRLNFFAPVVNNGIAARELQLVFYVRDYYSAKRIINELYSGPYRCDITSFKLSPTSSDTNDLTAKPVTASLNILYYEIVK